MSRRALRRGALATAGAAALTLATATPGNAATTAEWRMSSYESSVTGAMSSVDAISRTNAWAVGNTEHGQTTVNSPYVLHWIFFNNTVIDLAVGQQIRDAHGTVDRSVQQVRALQDRLTEKVAAIAGRLAAMDAERAQLLAQ